MLKRILVPLDSSEFTPAATRMAVTLVNRELAMVKEPVTLVGLGLVDLDQIPSGRFADVVPREQILKDAEQAVQELVQHFRDEVRGLGVPEAQIETVQLSGSPFRQIIRESVFCDLIVMGERCSFPPVNTDYETMHSLYHWSSRPVIITERGFRRVDKVVMVMDGTAPASRMLYNYLHLEPFPGAKVVLLWSKLEEEEFGLTEFFNRVERWLTTYGIEVEPHRIPGSVEAQIADVMIEENAQVLALGIHREHFLDRFRDPLHMRQNFAHRLMQSIAASLFIVQ